MKEIKFFYNKDCKKCKIAIEYFEKLHHRNKKAYGSFILDIEKLRKENRDLNEDDRIKGIIMIPDYNASGYLTYFHLEKQK